MLRARPMGTVGWEPLMQSHICPSNNLTHLIFTLAAIANNHSGRDILIINLLAIED